MRFALLLLLASCGPGPHSLNATLKGSLPCRDSSVAIIRSTVTGKLGLALPGTPITAEDGRPLEEFAGWTLVKLSGDRAVFTDGRCRVAVGPGR